MNVTFLIGNGFDLQLGMRTDYKSFLEWYVNLLTDDPEIARFRDHLKNEGAIWWSDAEIAMGEYLENFTDETITTYFKNIRDFKLELSEYLKRENSKYDLTSDPKVIDSFRSFILESAKDVMLHPRRFTLNEKWKTNQTVVNFVTFNYTNTLDRLVESLKESGEALQRFPGATYSYYTKVGEIVHVHGTLDSSIIMGVDNLEQLHMEDIIDGSKIKRTLIKPTVNDELGNYEHELAANIIRQSDYLFFYGLSFGETDQTWWKLIRHRLFTNENCQAVLFTRAVDGDINPIIPEDLLDYVNGKKEEFLQKIKIDPESKQYESVRKRVFIIKNTNRLDISLKKRRLITA